MEQNLQGGFKYKIEVYRDGVLDPAQTEEIENLCPTEGLNYFLTAGLLNTGAFGTWYIGIYLNNYTPVATDTMATFPTNAGESSGFSSPTIRPTWTPGAVSAGAVDNSASPAVFNSNASQTIYGGFVSSNQTVGSTTGKLVSAVKFSAPKVLDNTSVLKITAGFTMASS